MVGSVLLYIHRNNWIRPLATSENSDTPASSVNAGWGVFFMRDNAFNDETIFI